MGLKSPSDGRWDGRCRTGLVMSPRTERKRNALIRTFLALIVAYGDQPLADGVDHDGQDATSDDWTISRAHGSFDSLVWHVWHDAGGPGGATFHSFGVCHALRGPTSPFRGLTP
jgi:hypothetical protein